MGRSALVSVILTTYNSGERLRLVLDAILAQQGAGTEFDIELLVVDDCSTDGTCDLLRDMGIAFVTTRTNSGGPNRGRNIGLERATGDCITIADHDDIWHSDRLISLLPYLRTAPIVTSGHTLIEVNANRCIVRSGRTSGDDDHIFYAENATFLSRLIRSHQGQQAYLGSMLYSAELGSLRFEEEHGMADYDWTLKLFHRRSSVEVPRSLYARFVDGKNLSLTADYRTKDLALAMLTLDQYAERYPADVALARKRIHGSHARYLYLMGRMPEARAHFCHAERNIKTLLYYLTSFVGSRLVKRHLHVFG